MNRVDVAIHILPDNVSLYKLIGFDPDMDGTTYSTIDGINVNRAKYGYSILYSASDFMKLDLKSFVLSMIQIFNNNIPGALINTTLEYNYAEMLDEHYDEAVGIRIVNFGQMLDQVSNSSDFPSFHYDKSQNILDMVDNEFDDSDDDDDFYNDDYEEDDPFAVFFDEDYDDDDDREYRNKSYSDYYGRSRVVTNAKNAKRDMHRHGVIIASKSDINSDKKILKEFLKDFIPGNSSWKKEFRNDVLKRWMKMYCISKSDIRYINKQYRKANYKEKRNKNIENAINMTTRLFTASADSWYDPNR